MEESSLIWMKMGNQDENSRYCYEYCLTPLGQFTITWKPWKNDCSYEIELNEEYITVKDSLETAKLKAYSIVLDKYNELKSFLEL